MSSDLKPYSLLKSKSRSKSKSVKKEGSRELRSLRKSRSKTKSKSVKKEGSRELRSLRRSKSKSRSIPKSKSRPKSKSVKKEGSRELRSLRRSKSKIIKKEGSRKRRSFSKKNEGKKDQLVFTSIRPICSMRVQFFSDIHNSIPYTQGGINRDTTISKHIGQRKLCLTELYFLAEYAHLSNLIVYVGAAPGNHFPLLCDFFPKHKFHLYDDRDFDIQEKYIKSGQVVIFQQYFTDADVDKYKYKNILFISDIRGRDIVESTILGDMNMQKNWILEMKPIKSMVKFRMPYGDGTYCADKLQIQSKCTYEYLNGKMLLQPWAPITSTENRLIIDQNPTFKVYDCIEYEDKMYYHNLVTRGKPIDMNGKKYTWDYMQECAIIRIFKMKYPQYKDMNITELFNKKMYQHGEIRSL